MYSNDKITQSIADSVRKVMEEELKGKQHKIDANKNDKIDAHDFELLRKKKKVDEEVEQIDELSTEKLLAYRKKAYKRLNRTSWTSPKYDNRQDGVSRADDSLEKKHGTRSPGILARAKAKLRNEEVEELNGQLSFTDLIESYKTGGLKSFFENFEVDVVEEEATSDEFVAELEKAKRKAAGKEKNEVAKAAVQAVQQEEVEQIDEVNASEKIVAKGVAKTRAERDYHASKLAPDAWKYGSFAQVNPEITKKLHADADKKYGKALGDIKKTAVSKFLKTRKGDGKVHTEETKED